MALSSDLFPETLDGGPAAEDAIVDLLCRLRPRLRSEAHEVEALRVCRGPGRSYDAAFSVEGAVRPFALNRPIHDGAAAQASHGRLTAQPGGLVAWDGNGPAVDSIRKMLMASLREGVDRRQTFFVSAMVVVRIDEREGYRIRADRLVPGPVSYGGPWAQITRRAASGLKDGDTVLIGAGSAVRAELSAHERLDLATFESMFGAEAEDVHFFLSETFTRGRILAHRSRDLVLILVGGDTPLSVLGVFSDDA